jgi:hypothetical protein
VIRVPNHIGNLLAEVLVLEVLRAHMGYYQNKTYLLIGLKKQERKRGKKRMKTEFEKKTRLE